MDQPDPSREQERLRQARQDGVPWRKWGPYLSERQWGTVREDYSANGDAWNSFPHDHARSRAYRWGEDGIAGFCDDRMRLCFALALWNGRDPILKERLFGLTNSEGNHGEDVKEYYFYLDATPTQLLPEAAVQIPAGSLSLRRSGPGERRPQPPGDGVRAARHRALRPGPLLRCLRRVRQGGAGRGADPDQRGQPGPGNGRAAGAAPSVVPQHLVAVAGRAEAVAGAGSHPAGRENHRQPAPRPGHPVPGVRPRGRAAVHLQRDQRSPPRRTPELHPLRQGRHQRLHRGRRPRGDRSRRQRHQGRGPLRALGRAGGDPGGPPAVDRSDAVVEGGPVRRVRGDDGQPDPRGGRLLRRAHPDIRRTPTPRR